MLAQVIDPMYEPDTEHDDVGCGEREHEPPFGPSETKCFDDLSAYARNLSIA